MAPFSLYDYLGFILPGGAILFTAFFGWFGWPYPEPGSVALVGIVAASFVVGHANAALATWSGPVLLGSRPGGHYDSTWGLFGRGGRYDAEEERQVRSDFRRRYGDIPFGSAYNLGYTELQQRKLDAALRFHNEQIGFYRNMCCATTIALAIAVGYALSGRDHLEPVLWIPALTLGAALFAYRFRWFWARFGDNVVRGVRALD